MTDLSGIAGDTNSYTLDMLRRYSTTLAQTAEAGSTQWVLADISNAAIGDTLTIGAESRVIDDLPGEDAATLDAASGADHPVGAPVYGTGPVDVDSATVAFHFADVVKPVTVTDPMGAAVVTLDPADTADLAPWHRRAYRYELRATYPDGGVQTLRRGLLVVEPAVPTR